VTRSGRADARRHGALSRAAAASKSKPPVSARFVQAASKTHKSTFAVMVTTGTFHCCSGYGVLLRSPFLLRLGYCPSAVVALPFARGHRRRLSKSRFFESTRATFDHSQYYAPQQAHQVRGADAGHQLGPQVRLLGALRVNNCECAGMRIPFAATDRIRHAN